MVVSYWSGELPEITKLHFISFRRLNPEVEYVVYLENDSGFEGSLSKAMVDLLKELKIEVASVSLSSLMAVQGVPPFSKFNENYLDLIGRKIFRKLSQYFSDFLF